MLEEKNDELHAAYTQKKPHEDLACVQYKPNPVHWHSLKLILAKEISIVEFIIWVCTVKSLNDSHQSPNKNGLGFQPSLIPEEPFPLRTLNNDDG